jgi:hypothetical protein
MQAKKFERAIKRYGRALEPLESDYSFSSEEKDRAKVRFLRPRTTETLKRRSNSRRG